MDISRKEKDYLLSIARKAIESRFSGAQKYYPERVPEKFSRKMGVFVTLREQGELRGCIGYPLPIEPVAQAIADNAINAAFHDPRFPPLRKEEAGRIEVEITILTAPKTVEFSSPEELLGKIEIGRDGLILEFRGYAGLLLPQVPVEEKWGKEQYLSYLCMKAGLPPETWRTQPIRIKAFSGIVIGEG